MLQKQNLLGKKATKIWPIVVELISTYPTDAVAHFNTAKESVLTLKTVRLWSTLY